MHRIPTVWVPWLELLRAFDSLHLTLLPQFNRQQRKKGRGRQLQSVSQPSQKDVS